MELPRITRKLGCTAFQYETKSDNNYCVLLFCLSTRTSLFFSVVTNISVRWSPGVTVDSRDVTDVDDEGERPLA